MSSLPGGRLAVTRRHPAGRPDPITWAATEAGRLLARQPDRWRHTQEVALRAWWASAGLTAGEQELLLAAAYLHDIGYADDLVDPGFHPLDAARYLRRHGQQQVAELAAYHSGAAADARHWGLVAQLDEFPSQPGPVSDTLTYCDTTAGPDVGRAGAEPERVIDRHSADRRFAGSRADVRLNLHCPATRTLRRVSAARPTQNRQAVTAVQMGCITLLRPEGILAAAEALTRLREAFHVAHSNQQTHRIVVDLALVTSVSGRAARELWTLGTSSQLPTVLLAPAPATVAALEQTRPAASGYPRITSSIPTALTEHCSCR